VTETGPTSSDVALHTFSQVLALHTTGSGATVTGAELNVPVATSCTIPFFVVAGFGLMEMDSSVRGEPPQLLKAKPNTSTEIVQRLLLRGEVRSIFDTSRACRSPISTA
jgi:hypothetical protein